MLVLARKMGECIMIGDDIKIIYLGHSDSQIKIGIECPREIPVHREEIFNKIKNGIKNDEC